jgi:hypothetical protein
MHGVNLFPVVLLRSNPLQSRHEVAERLRLPCKTQLASNQFMESLDLVGIAEPRRHLHFYFMACLPRSGAKDRRDSTLVAGLPRLNLSANYPASFGDDEDFA